MDPWVEQYRENWSFAQLASNATLHAPTRYVRPSAPVTVVPVTLGIEGGEGGGNESPEQ